MSFGLYFYDHPIVNHNISPIRVIYLNTLIESRDCFFNLNDISSLS